MRNVDFVVLAGETQRVPSLALPSVLAPPGPANDLARDVVAEIFLDLAELFDRTDVGFLVKFAQRRRPGVLATVDAALRQLPGVSLVDMLGPVDAAADEHAPGAIDPRGADAGGIRSRFEPRHHRPQVVMGGARAAVDNWSPGSNRGLCCYGGRALTSPRKAAGRPRAAPSLDMNRLS